MRFNTRNCWPIYLCPRSSVVAVYNWTAELAREIMDFKTDSLLYNSYVAPVCSATTNQRLPTAHFECLSRRRIADFSFVRLFGFLLEWTIRREINEWREMNEWNLQTKIRLGNLLVFELKRYFLAWQWELDGWRHEENGHPFCYVDFVWLWFPRMTTLWWSDTVISLTSGKPGGGGSRTRLVWTSL